MTLEELSARRLPDLAGEVHHKGGGSCDDLKRHAEKQQT
jgi:hypothetical protein